MPGRKIRRGCLSQAAMRPMEVMVVALVIYLLTHKISGLARQPFQFRNNHLYINHGILPHEFKDLLVECVIPVVAHDRDDIRLLGITLRQTVFGVGLLPIAKIADHLEINDAKDVGLDLLDGSGVNVGTHLRRGKKWRLFQSKGDEIDAIIQLRPRFSHHAGGLQQSSHSTGVVIGSRLIPANIVMGSNDQPLAILWLVGGNDIPVADIPC